MHKKNNWKSENEFRAILIDNEKSSELINLKVPYLDNTLAEIIFGFRMPENKINNILNLLKKYYSNYSEIKISMVLPNYEKYKLENINIKNYTKDELHKLLVDLPNRINI